MSDLPSLPLSGKSPLDEYLKKKLSDASTPADQYFAHLTFAITRFQLLEQELKMYLVVANNRIREEVSKIFEYRYNQDAIFNMPLKRLAHQFRVHGGDPELAKRIEGLVDARNRVAHEGFVTVPEEVFGDLSAIHVKSRLSEMKEVAKGVEGVPYLVSLETHKIIGKTGPLIRRPEPIDTDDGSTTSQGGLNGRYS